MTPAAPARAAAPARRVVTAPAPVRAPSRRSDPQPSETHLRVVPRGHRRTRFAVVAVVLASLVIVFGLVSFHVVLVQSQFELERLEQEVEREKEQFERLRLEAAELSSPERILDLARTQLGMVDPAGMTHLTAPEVGAVDDDTAPDARAWAEIKPFLAAEP